MSLIKVLREQSAINFDGRINFRDENTSQYLGSILICSGMLVGCHYNGELGKKALINMLVTDISSTGFDVVVEPEVISLDQFQFEIELKELEVELRQIVEESEKNKKLKPPGNLRLMVDPDFVCRGLEISSKEFDVLCLISDYGKVQDLYEHSKLLDFEVTNSLISLRKKGALKVVS